MEAERTKLREEINKKDANKKIAAPKRNTKKDQSKSVNDRL